MLLPAALSLSWPGVAAHAQTQSVIPLQYVPTGTNSYSLGINVGINGGAPQLYMFDTGSSLFNAAFNPNTWAGFGQAVPRSPFMFGNGLTYCYAANTCMYANVVQVPTLNFYAPGATATSPVAASLTANPGFQIGAVYGSTDPNLSFPSYFQSPNPPPPFLNTFYGIFGAGNFTTMADTGIVVGGVLGQAILPGVRQGYVVSANGQPNPGSYNASGQPIGPVINGPSGSQTVTIAGRAQQVSPCTACVTLGLTPQLIGQFAPVGTPGQAPGQPGVIPWSQTSRDAFPNPYGGTPGNPSSTSTGSTFSVGLAPPGGPSVSRAGPGVLDTGTPALELSNAWTGSNTGAGTTVTIAGTTADGGPIAGLPASNATLTGDLPNYSKSYTAFVGTKDHTTVGISFFMQNSVMFDQSDQVIGYTPFYVTTANLATTANGPLMVSSANVPLGLAGVVSGPGGIVIGAGAQVQLSASNTYAGTTMIAAASGGAAAGQLLVSGPGSIASSAGVANNGVFDISRAWSPVSIQTLSGSGQVNLGGQTLVITNASDTFSGTIADGGAWPAGGGSLALSGGAFTFSGIGSYTGGTVVNGGAFTLNGSLIGPVGISPAGSLTVGPAATLTGTIANAGSFANDGLVAGTIFSSGLLSGNGTVAGAVNSTGTLSPGSSIGTMTVNGSLAQVGGAYQAEVTGSGRSDLINVVGPATIQGGSVNVSSLPGGPFAARTTYKLLSATGGITGTFATVNELYPFLLSSLSYDPNNVYLTLEVGGFAAAAQTRTQRAVGSVLDANVGSATGDFSTVLGSMAPLTAAQGQAAMTALSGNNYAAFSSSMVAGAQLFMSTFANQAGGGGSPASNRVALAEACDVACDTTAPAAWGAWGSALGGLGTIGANAATGSVTYNVGGFAAGLDRLVAPNLRVGVTAGYTTGSQWVGGFNGKGMTDTFQAGLYGGYNDGRVYADALLGYASSANQMWRTIAIPGLQPRTAQGYTGANQWYGQVETGYRFDIGTAANAFVTPFARLHGYTGTQNAFSETGAQSLDLTVATQTTSSLRSVLGAQLGGSMDLGWRERLAVQLRLGWSHEYASTARPVTASFAGAPTSPFTTYGVAPQRDGVVMGFSASTAIAEGMSLFLRYEGDISGQDSAHALTAGVRMTW